VAGSPGVVILSKFGLLGDPGLDRELVGKLAKTGDRLSGLGTATHFGEQRSSCLLSSADKEIH